MNELDVLLSLIQVVEMLELYTEKIDQVNFLIRKIQVMPSNFQI